MIKVCNVKIANNMTSLLKEKHAKAIIYGGCESFCKNGNKNLLDKWGGFDSKDTSSRTVFPDDWGINKNILVSARLYMAGANFDAK